MRITTSQMFERPTALMAGLSQRADAIQTQIATGKRFTAPSGDAAGWQRLQTLRIADADDAAWKENVTLAQGILAQSDTALGAIETQLQRAQELATQAGSDTLSPADRAGIATALDAILEDVLALANGKDVRGQPLFGGTRDGAAFVRNADGQIAYAGGDAPSAIPVGRGSEVQATVPGSSFLGDGAEGVFATLQRFASALRSGEGAAAASGEALAGIGRALDDTAAARASVGARAMRLDLEAERLGDAALDRSETREVIAATDTPTAIAELQKTLTILQATQASFTKLTGLSLFDYLR